MGCSKREFGSADVGSDASWPRRPRARESVASDTRGLARTTLDSRGDARIGGEDERIGAGVPPHAAHEVARRGSVERAQAAAGAISRRGAGPGTRGVPRAASALDPDTKSGCSARGRAPPKPGRRGRAPGSTVNTARAGDSARPSWRHGRNRDRRCRRATRAPRGRIDSRVAPPGVTCASTYDARGRHPRREAPKCGASVVDARSGVRALSAGSSRAGRRGATECIAIESTEAGGARKHRPLAAPWPRERHGDTAGRRTASRMHERAIRSLLANEDRVVHGSRSMFAKSVVPRLEAERSPRSS